jgi:hypothetical protein
MRPTWFNGCRRKRKLAVRTSPHTSANNKRRYGAPRVRTMCHTDRCPGGKIPDKETDPEAYALYLASHGDIYDLDRALETVCSPKTRMSKRYPDLSRRVIEKANKAVRDPIANRKFAGVTANMQAQLRKAQPKNVRQTPKGGFLSWLFGG